MSIIMPDTSILEETKKHIDEDKILVPLFDRFGGRQELFLSGYPMLVLGNEKKEITTLSEKLNLACAPYEVEVILINVNKFYTKIKSGEDVKNSMENDKIIYLVYQLLPISKDNRLEDIIDYIGEKIFFKCACKSNNSTKAAFDSLGNKKDIVRRLIDTLNNFELTIFYENRIMVRCLKNRTESINKNKKNTVEQFVNV